MDKPIYELVGRVNTPKAPIMEDGGFEVPLKIPNDDDELAKKEAERIFDEKFSELETGQSIFAYVHKNGTQIGKFPEVWKE